ncbi:MAG: DinB family protein [Planctomycetia bacterium]
MEPQRLIVDEFAAYARGKLEDSLALIERCVDSLTPEQIWHRPNDVSNSIGNLILHLSGNIRQWIGDAVGGVPHDRNRPAEFAQREIVPTAELVAGLRQAVAVAVRALERLAVDDFLRVRVIQGYQVTALAAVFHAVEHFSLHTGQIVYATKILTGVALAQYHPDGRRIDGRTDRVP